MLFALEAAICLLMAAPLVLPRGLMNAGKAAIAGDWRLPGTSVDRQDGICRLTIANGEPPAELTKPMKPTALFSPPATADGFQLPSEFGEPTLDHIDFIEHLTADFSGGAIRPNFTAI